MRVALDAGYAAAHREATALGRADRAGRFAMIAPGAVARCTQKRRADGGAGEFLCDFVLPAFERTQNIDLYGDAPNIT